MLNSNNIASLFLIYVRITMKCAVISIQLPVKYPQLPAYLIGYIETLIWRIHALGNYSCIDQWQYTEDRTISFGVLQHTAFYMNIEYMYVPSTNSLSGNEETKTVHSTRRIDSAQGQVLLSSSPLGNPVI